MAIIKLKEKFQIEISEKKEVLRVQEFELTTSPGSLTYGDVIKDLETLYSLDTLSFSDDLLHELRQNSFLAEKYRDREKTNLYFLKKGFWLIDGSSHFDYIGLSQVQYHPEGQIVVSEGPNGNYLLESWKRGKPKYENFKYSIITIDS